MSWPQGLVVIGMVVNLSFAFAAHGSPRTGRWNAVHNVIAVCALAVVLYAGGFFGAAP